MSLDDPLVLAVELAPHIDWAERFLESTDPAPPVPEPEAVTVAVTLLIAAANVADRISRVEAQAFGATWIAALINIGLAVVQCHEVQGALDDLLFVISQTLRDQEHVGRHAAELLMALRDLVQS